MSLLGVDVLAGADLNPASSTSTVSCQDTWKVVLVHDIAVFCPLLLFLDPSILFLILSKNEVTSPTSLSSTKTAPLGIGCACDRLGDAVLVASLVVGVVLSEVDVELTLRICAARDSCEGGTTAAGAELLAHVLNDLEAGVAAQDLR